MGEIWMCVFKTLFNKIAAELFDKTHGSSNYDGKFESETVFFERYAGVRRI